MRRLVYIFFIVITMFTVVFSPSQTAYATGLCYVNDNAGGTNTGTSWANAYTSLQSAIADSCTEIWVAAGTYKPHTSDRTTSFALENGVAIYGGFDGTESLLSERDYLSNVTILSGDLLGNDSGFTNNNENSYHVVIGSGTNNTAILDGFTIKGGNANTYPGLTGGGVYNFAGNPTLANIKITGNTATDRGGGIDNINSAPNLTNITISGNTSYDGGGMYNLNSAPILLNISFSSNSASNIGGGIHNENSSPLITDSSITNNSAGNSGGGMHNNLQSNPSLTNVSFTNNTAPQGGGLSNANNSAPSLTYVSFSANIATSSSGGGISNWNSNPLLTNVTFTNNQALTLFGGGMYSWGTSNPTLLGVTFKNNSAFRGGGIYVDLTGVAEITNTTFEGNTATQDGGGFYNSGTSTIINTTFYGNSSTNEGGAINNSGILTIKNSTISNSTALDGGGVFNLGTLNYSNTIIANTVSGGDCFSFPVISTNITNLVEDGSCSATVSGDPNLGPLADNGGPTQTMALLNSSPAINTGDDASCISTDQRGIVRPQGTHCDIGAYEKSGGYLPSSPTFGDVPMSHPYWADIEILYANGFTGGCSASPLLFCPETTMDRAQGAVFMLRGLVGTSYVPPVAPFANPFGDSWAPGPWAQRWAQGMLDEGLTAGCSASPLLYCPWDQMPRAQAAVFGMRLLNGSAYLPPAGTGTVFADVNGSEWYAGWAEQAYANGLLPACGTSGGRPLFCPNSLVSRGLGAYMIVKARNLTMP